MTGCFGEYKLRNFVSNNVIGAFDNDTLKLVLDRVLIKADGTEEYIWKDLGIV